MFKIKKQNEDYIFNDHHVNIPFDCFQNEDKFYIQASITENILIIKLVGKFNYKNQRMFRDYCLSKIQDIICHHINTIELDFRNLETIDTTALGALLLVKNSLCSSVQINITNCPQTIYHIFKRSLLHRFFEIN